MVDEITLKKKKSQPKFVKNMDWFARDEWDPHEYTSRSIHPEVSYFSDTKNS